MREIELTRGYKAIVDDADFERVSASKWHVWTNPSSKTQYAVRNVLGPKGKTTTQGLHRFLMSPPAHLEIDHMNGNGLDNRKSNLRIVSRAENMKNRQPASSNKSGASGVR